MQTIEIESNTISYESFKNQVLEHYRLVCISREASKLGRREALTGKAKFGIFGAGKELPQIAMASVFKNGDFRSGYYRDQTFMFAIGELTLEGFFAQLYSLTDKKIETSSAGRQMTSHFSTKSLNDDGTWRILTEQKNSSSDISPTAGQMPRLLGLAQASKVYRALPDIDTSLQFSVNGNEIAFGTIGDASTSEGHFWETLNAAGVMQIPMVLSIWDDGYGISVPGEYQHTKASLSELLSGFQRNENERGIEIITVKAWDYVALMEAYKKAENIAREEHIPVVVHVEDCTQPQGHSSSGSHERYKSEERLNWEIEFDCIKKFREWILSYYNEGDFLATHEELDVIEKEAKSKVRTARKLTWEKYLEPILGLKGEAIQKIKSLEIAELNEAIQKLEKSKTPFKKEIFALVRKAIWLTAKQSSSERDELINWYQEQKEIQQNIYSSHLHSENQFRVGNVEIIEPKFPEEIEQKSGREILRDNFDVLFSKYPNVITFGEDSGSLGDVNQGLEGLQKKYGETRVADTGIRETTIVGQAIGLAMRGLRPIAEIQYLDYILYGLQTLSDDLATLHYRTVGQQKAPAIIRTRGHRLEGIWHSGSHMGALIHLIRGMNLLVPRNLTKAAGFYNTLLQADEPAVVIEVLNAYRLKESLPINLGEFTTPIGEVEITKEGTDVTLVTYGATWQLVSKAALELESIGINAEVIDVQSLLPFDLKHDILESVKKTNRLVVIDEDVPGGASAYIMQEVLEKQGAYNYLDSQPKTITAKAHRSAYASDGDYFSNPSVDDIVEGVYELFNELNPNQFPKLF